MKTQEFKKWFSDNVHYFNNYDEFITSGDKSEIIFVFKPKNKEPLKDRTIVFRKGDENNEL